MAKMAKLNEIPLITRRNLFGNPDKTFVRLSPDGTRMAYLAPANGVLNVWVGPAEDPTAAKANYKRYVSRHTIL